MSEFRILDYNYCFDSTVGLTASSEATDFAVTNLNSHLRSKVWRSNGYFLISSSNNKVDFNDGSGAVSGTITSGGYTATELGTEIKTRMDAAGSLVHTVTYNESTGLWTISVPSGTFSLLWSSGVNSANSIGSSIGFDTSSDGSGATSYTGSTIAIHTEEWVQIDLKSTEPIDSIALVFDAVDGIKLSNAAVVKIQASATPYWVSPAVDVTLSVDSTFDIYTYRWSSDQSYRYWRVYIQDPTNANLFVELGVVFLSKATQLTQLPSIGFDQTLTDLSQRQQNDYGNEYFDVYPSRREFSFNHTAMSEADIQTLYDIYNRVGKVTPICVWLDPEGGIFDKDRFFLYGRLQGSFKAKQVFYTFFDQELTVLEAL